MNKQQLAAKIWASANKMRSNKIEVQDYKDYILGFIFYKYLSDTEVKKLREIGMDDDSMKEKLVPSNKDLVKYCKDNFGYFISYDNLFSTWIKKKQDFTVKNVSNALSAFSRNIQNAYKGVFNNIFNTLETGLSKLGETTGSQTKSISELIHLIKDIPTDNRQGYDVLGFIYEYLIGKFAANAGKKAGEFYTPHEVAVLMAEIVAEHLKDRDHIDIYDPTSGSGSLLITIGSAVNKYLKGENKVKYYAQELKEPTYNLTRMNLVMRGIQPENIITRNDDTLGQDWPMITERGTYNLMRVDAVVSNPPYSQEWNVKAGDPRFKLGLAPKSKADYAFLLHSLYHLNPDGIMTIVLPTGVLYRGEEYEIRKNLIERGHLETVIALPENLFYGTGIPTIIMILRQKREADDVLFIDATKCCHKPGKKNELRASDIRRIKDAVIERKRIPNFSELVTKEVIREENDYNLYIPRYVASSEPAEREDLYAHIFGGIPNAELNAFADYWSEFPTLHDELFTTDDSLYSSVKANDIPSTITNNSNVQAFAQHYAAAFEGFDNLLCERLINGMEELDTANELTVLSNEMFSRVEPFAPLVDKYSVYQILDNHWSTIATDIEIIQTEGFDATRQVDPDIQVKTKKDGTEEEVNKGWVGHIIPFDLVQRTLLKDEKEELDDCIGRLENTVAGYSAVMDTLTDEEQETYLNEDGDAFDMDKVADGLDELLSAIETPEIKKLQGYLKVLDKSGKKADKLAYIEKTKGVDWSAMAAAKDGTYNKSTVENRIFSLRSATEFDEESTEYKLDKVLRLSFDEKALKREVKDRTFALEAHTIETIQSLSDEEVLELLELKWITPLCEDILTVPGTIVQSFTSCMVELTAKYAETLHHINTQIAEAESALAEMLGDLRGDEYDMAAIRELQQMMRGHVGSDCIETLYKLCNDKMFAKSGERVPKVRFTGFDGAWKEKKISDDFDILKNNSLPRAELNYTNGEVKNIHYGDVLIKFGSCIDAKTDYIPFITDSIIAQKASVNKLENGDIIIADTAEDTTAGKCSELTNKADDEVFVSGLHTIPLHPKKAFAIGFMGNFMNTSSFHDQLIPFMQGTKVLGISKTAISDIPVRYPSSLEEQSRISEFFATLNSLITLRTQQLAKLKSLKTSCLQKMFV